MMEKRTNEDMISNLPWDVLDAILVCMPLKEVARTSILSTKWINRWTGLSQFVIDDKCISSLIFDKVARWEAIMEIIRQVQLYHTGPIEKFKLAAYCRPDHYDLNEWIHFLVDKGLKEFILQEFDSVQPFNLPVALYSCPLLSRLELFGCRVEPPSASIGFKSLTSLQLNHVCVRACMLESLILNSPVLERVTLLNLDHAINVKISNRNLKFLKVDSNFEDICLENSPSLASVDIGLRGRFTPRLHGSGEGNLIRVIGCLHALRKLTLSSSILGFLASNGVPDRLPALLQHLSVLELKDVRLDCMTEVTICVCILKSAPNLEELRLSVADTTGDSIPAADFLVAQYVLNLQFEKLKMANIRAVRGVRTEWILVRFLLARSPILKRLTIVHYGSERLPAEVIEQVEPASKDVEILNLSV